MPAKPMTIIVRRGLESVCRQFSDCAASFGFGRTRKMLWTRPHDHTVDVIHFHRSGSSYGAPISANVEVRVHFAIRVFNDPFSGLALNGPTSDATRVRSGRYHLRFNARSGDMLDRCVEDLVRFVQDHGEPWFREFHDPERLLDHSRSPLREEARDSLLAAIRGEANPENIAASRKLLGLPKTETP